VQNFIEGVLTFANGVFDSREDDPLFENLRLFHSVRKLVKSNGAISDKSGHILYVLVPENVNIQTYSWK